jgi:magnesium transporter
VSQSLEPKSDIELIDGDVFNVEELRHFAALVETESVPQILYELDTLHPSDVAELIELLSPDMREKFVRLVDKKIPAEVFAELDPKIMGEIVDHMDFDTFVSAVQELDSDDAVFILEDMDEKDVQEVLEQIPETERLVLQRALDYLEDSAGRMMRSDYVAVPPFWTVGQTIDYLREDRDLPDEFLEIFVVEPTHKPIGIVQLNQVLRAQRSAVMGEIIDDDFTAVSVDMDREQVARLFERYNLVSAPVVDSEQRMVGVITADDILEVITEEAGEDILRLGGVTGEATMSDSVVSSVRGRFSWLFVNLATAIAASLVIGLFDASIEKMVALAVLMPIVASMGGNAGTQTLTIAVRGLATRELSVVTARRVILREVGIGLINGLLFAVIGGLIGAFWFNDLWLGIVLAMAMMVTLIMAALSGILVPIGLDRMGLDPAVASSVFVTTVTDVIGFLAFLGFATILLLG